jgi:NTE family protein
MRTPWKLKVGLALGGGAARGMAHVGVLRALEREKIPIDVIAGTSMGAIIGGAYAAQPDAEALEQRVREVLSSEQFKRNRLSFLKESKERRGGLFFSVANLIRRGIFYGVSNMRASFLSAEEFAHSMESILPETPIEDLPLRFGAVTLDIESAEEVVLCHGNLRDAAAASSAIPGILPPVRRNDRVLIDGGWVDKIPILPAFKMGADVVIGVDISADLQDARSYNRGVDIMVRANSIKDATLVAMLGRMADVLIRPAVKHVHWADFGAYERCIRAGDEATSNKVSEIREMLRHERLFSMVRPRIGKRLAELHMQSGDVELAIE